MLAVALPGISPAQSPSTLDKASWSVVVRASSFRYRHDLQVVAPQGSPRSGDAGVAASAVAEAQVTLLRTLSAGDPGQATVMRLVVPRGTALPASGELKLVAEVKRDADGALWAGDAWMEVNDRLCLSVERIAELEIGSAFAASTAGSDGERCIGI